MQNHTPSSRCQYSIAPRLIFPCSGASDVENIQMAVTRAAELLGS